VYRGSKAALVVLMSLKELLFVISVSTFTYLDLKTIIFFSLSLAFNCFL
jgi:hypothetical protein